MVKRGRRGAVVLSIDDLESVEETLDVMTRLELLAQIWESLAESRDDGAAILTKDQARAFSIG